MITYYGFFPIISSTVNKYRGITAQSKYIILIIRKRY
jgi:hypothetical protein